MFDIFSNPVISGGLLLMVTGAAMAIFREAPKNLWWWMKRRFLVTLVVYDKDPIFEWLVIWMDRQLFTKNARMLNARLVDTSWDSDGRVFGKVTLTLGKGHHLFFYRGRPVWFYRDRETANGLMSTVIETFYFQILSRDQSLVHGLIEDALRSVQEARAERTEVYTNSRGWWYRVHGFQARSIDTVILPGQQREKIVQDVHNFLENRERYQELGVPWHRGYLFSGIPGTGKSSTIAALAGYFKMPLYVLNLASHGMSDEDLIHLMLKVMPKSMVILEDVDSVLPKDREKPKTDGEDEKETGGSKVSMSTLLNCLDGVVAKEGMLVFMTTNHPEKLDPSLIRPGRVDYRLEFGYAEPDQIKRMFRRFRSYGEDVAFVRQFQGRNVTLAEVQQLLLKEEEPVLESVAAA